MLALVALGSGCVGVSVGYLYREGIQVPFCVIVLLLLSPLGKVVSNVVIQ